MQPSLLLAKTQFLTLYFWPTLTWLGAIRAVPFEPLVGYGAAMKEWSGLLPILKVVLEDLFQPTTFLQGQSAHHHNAWYLAPYYRGGRLFRGELLLDSMMCPGSVKIEAPPLLEPGDTQVFVYLLRCALQDAVMNEDLVISNGLLAVPSVQKTPRVIDFSMFYSSSEP